MATCSHGEPAGRCALCKQEQGALNKGIISRNKKRPSAPQPPPRKPGKKK